MNLVTIRLGKMFCFCSVHTSNIQFLILFNNNLSMNLVTIRLGKMFCFCSVHTSISNIETEKVTSDVTGTDDPKGSFTQSECERESEFSSLTFVVAECEH